MSGRPGRRVGIRVLTAPWGRGAAEKTVKCRQIESSSCNQFTAQGRTALVGANRAGRCYPTNRKLDRVCGGAGKIRGRPGAQPSSRKEMDRPMAQIDIEILQPFAARFLEGTNLTPAERAEVLRTGQGFACKAPAPAGGVSPETTRARRKRIY